MTKTKQKHAFIFCKNGMCITVPFFCCFFFIFIWVHKEFEQHALLVDSAERIQVVQQNFVEI